MNDTNGKLIKLGDKLTFSNVAGMAVVDVIEENGVLGFNDTTYSMFCPIEKLFMLKSVCKDRRVEIVNDI